MKTNKFFSVLLTLAILLGIFTIPVMAEENIKVVLNGTELTFDVPPQIINDRTMVPMRKIFEAMGATVQWKDDTQTVTATKENIVIVMQIDNSIIMVSGKSITLDVSPQLVDGRTLVPVRAVAEGLDADVKWDGDTQTVIITKEENPIVTPIPTPAPAPVPKSEAVDKLPEGKYHYYELSDNDMKDLKDSYNDLLQNFEKSSLPNLKNNPDSVKEIKAESDAAVKLVKDAWNKAVTTRIIDLQINSDDEYIVDGDQDLMQENYMEIVRKSGLEASDCLEVSFMSLGDGSVTMFLDFKKPDTHVVIPVIAGANNTIEILQSKEMKEFSIIN